MGTCWIVEFAVPADYGLKQKESEKRDKYIDLAKELKIKTMGTGIRIIISERYSSDFPLYQILHEVILL